MLLLSLVVFKLNSLLDVFMPVATGGMLFSVGSSVHLSVHDQVC